MRPSKAAKRKQRAESYSERRKFLGLLAGDDEPGSGSGARGFGSGARGSHS